MKVSIFTVEWLFSSAAVTLLFLGPTQSQSPSILVAPQGEKEKTWLSFVIIVGPFLSFPFGSDSFLIFDIFTYTLQLVI